MSAAAAMMVRENILQFIGVRVGLLTIFLRRWLARRQFLALQFDIGRLGRRVAQRLDQLHWPRRNTYTTSHSGSASYGGGYHYGGYGGYHYGGCYGGGFAAGAVTGAAVGAAAASTAAYYNQYPSGVYYRPVF